MCGICGIINFDDDPVRQEDLKVMMHEMKHRGPDDEGIFIDNNVGLGFVRLSILDLSHAGHQPMNSHDERYVIVFNGEVYNYIELKEDLKAKYLFKTGTDTEVVLAAYQEWGEKCLDRFNGMFAFMIFDKKTKSLFGARDRYGIKPFYYYQDSNRFIFASDIPSLINVIEERISPDELSIFDYLAFGRTDQNENTFFSQIKKLQHSHCIKLSPNSKRYNINRWYDISNISSCPITDPHELRQLIISSIKIRMRSDVPVGVSLSGGIDSSSIVGVLSKKLAYKDLYTFSSVYHENHRANEKPSIDLIKLNNSKFVYPTAESFFEDMDDIMNAHSEPFSTSAIYAQYKVMQLAKENVTVLLDGQGADEYFAGYPYFHGYYYKGLFRSLNFIRLAKEIAGYSKLNGDASNLKFFSYLISPKFLKIKALNNQKNYLRDVFVKKNIKDSTILNELYQSKDLLQASINHFEYKMEHLLKWEDRNSMNFSIESRVPFLDNRLVEGIMAAPSEYKIKNGVTKHLLKQSMLDIVPNEILNNTNKIGFATPEDLWFRSSMFNDFLNNFRLNNTFLIEKYVERSQIEQLMDNQLQGKVNASSEIWRLINLEQWMQKYFN